MPTLIRRATVRVLQSFTWLTAHVAWPCARLLLFLLLLGFTQPAW